MNAGRSFLRRFRLLTRYEADTKGGRDPLTRLTNNQIAHSLQDLLHTHQHIADELIGDPVDKHGYSRQTELGLSGAYLQTLCRCHLNRVVARSMPPILTSSAGMRIGVAGNDWEKCHWASHNYLYTLCTGVGRLCEGPQVAGRQVSKSPYRPNTNTACSCVTTAVKGTLPYRTEPLRQRTANLRVWRAFSDQTWV